MVNRLCELYKEQSIVCPPNPQRYVFQTGAFDNLDDDPKSARAKWSFHETAISRVRYVNQEQPGEIYYVALLKDMGSGKGSVDTLPDDYSIAPL